MTKKKFGPMDHVGTEQTLHSIFLCMYIVTSSLVPGPGVLNML